MFIQLKTTLDNFYQLYQKEYIHISDHPHTHYAVNSRFKTLFMQNWKNFQSNKKTKIAESMYNIIK